MMSFGSNLLRGPAKAKAALARNCRARFILLTAQMECAGAGRSVQALRRFKKIVGGSVGL